MDKIKFIYFDIGGVMADTDDYFKGATKKFGINLDEFIKFWEGDNNRNKLTRGIITPQEFWKSAIKKFNLKETENFNFVESWMDDYKPIIEVHSLAQELSKKYKIGLISNLYKGMMPRLVELGKVADINYSAIILSYEVGLNKNSKEIFEFAAKKSGVKPEEILLIDDRKDFLENARSVDWQTFWFDESRVEESVKKLKNLLL